MPPTTTNATPADNTFELFQSISEREEEVPENAANKNSAAYLAPRSNRIQRLGLLSDGLPQRLVQEGR